MARCDISRSALRWFSPFIFFALVGCGTMKWAYDYADWWIEYKIEQWVDLSGEQEDQLQNGLSPFFKWHRVAIMPRVTDSVSNLIAAAQKGQCAQRFASQQNLWNKLYQETIERITPIISGVLVTLDDKQILELESGLKEEFKQAQEKAADPTQRSEKFLDRMDSMLGRLSQGQREMLAQPDTDWEKHNQASLACRSDHQRQLVEALKAKQERLGIELILNRWWTQSGCPKEFLDNRTRMRNRWQTKMAKFETTLSEEQRESMLGELESLRSNLSDIIK